MDLYADQIIDHSKHPRHAGSIRDASVVHEEANISCGDRVRLEVRVENGTVADVGWLGTGCAISQAGMSLLSEYAIGKTVDQLLALKKPDVLAILGVPVSERRMKCALLGLHTLLNTLRLQQALAPQSWSETVAPPATA